MIELSSDPIIRKIDAGMPLVFHAAVEKARLTKTKLVISQNGAMVELDPDGVKISEMLNVKPNVSGNGADKRQPR